MAKYRITDVSAGQGLFLSVNLQEQLLPGSLEYMLNQIIETKINTSIFDKNYKNDLTGASAVPPKVLLKLIIYSYSKGLKSSRQIWRMSKENIIAKALTDDMDIHWTTISDFIPNNSNDFQEIFMKVLIYCNELGLIGGETFAIDGLRLPSNASIEMSGTKKKLGKRLKVYRKMAEKHFLRHSRMDENGDCQPLDKERFEERQKHLNRQIEKISDFLENMEPKLGRNGKEKYSNVTDNDSALIKSSNGFIQGYTGLAVSDKKNQIIVSAEVTGSSSECECLPMMLDKTVENLEDAGFKGSEESPAVKILGDAHYFSEDNFRACQERGVEAIIPDSQAKKQEIGDGQKRYTTSDFTYHDDGNYYECPHGKCLSYKRTIIHGGVENEVYQASFTDCKICPDLSKCSRSKKEPKQGKVLRINESNKPDSLCHKMRKKMSTEEYQEQYSYRIQIIEPVFSNIRYCKGLNRFTLRGKEKVSGQWLLYCIVHNLGKCLKGYNNQMESA
jgi:transposase